MIEKNYSEYTVGALTLMNGKETIDLVSCNLKLRIYADGEPDSIDIDIRDVAELISTLSSKALPFTP
jgi:hypothetical protein